MGNPVGVEAAQYHAAAWGNPFLHFKIFHAQQYLLRPINYSTKYTQNVYNTVNSTSKHTLRSVITICKDVCKMEY
jgi:hypothetical protein